MTVTVIGIDPSLRRTGLARITLADLVTAGDGPPAAAVRLARSVETWVRTAPGHPSDDLERRWARIFGIAADVLAYALPCELVVIEGPSYQSLGGSAWDRAGLWWRIVGRLTDAEIPVALVPPTTRAKWATGSGSADKAAVRDAMIRLWHPFWTPTHPNDDNESDALALASMGAHWLDRLPVAGHGREALGGAVWPDREAVAV